VYNKGLCQLSAAEVPHSRWKIRHILLHNKSYCNSQSLHYKSLVLKAALALRVCPCASLGTCRCGGYWCSDL